jgi:hypothetical protein
MQPHKEAFFPAKPAECVAYGQQVCFSAKNSRFICGVSAPVFAPSRLILSFGA